MYPPAEAQAFVTTPNVTNYIEFDSNRNCNKLITPNVITTTNLIKWTSSVIANHISDKEFRPSVISIVSARIKSSYQGVTNMFPQSTSK